METVLPNNWKPRVYQLPMWRYLEGGGTRAVACWHRRCLAVGTQVTMSDGSWECIENLKSGDEILTWVDGEYRADRVKDVWCAGTKRVDCVSVAGFPDVIATQDHRFFTYYNEKPFDWIALSDIRENKGKGSPRRLTIYSGHNEGTISDTTKAELFGYLLTDGSVNDDQQPKFTNSQWELIDRVAELAEIYGASPKIRPKGNGWDIGLSNGTNGGGEISNPIKEMFRSEGSLGKHKERRTPKFLWQSDTKTIAAFFAAVVDGDGSLWKFDSKRAFGDKFVDTAAEIKIHVGESEVLAWDYYWLLRKIGIAASRVVCEKDSCWTVRIWRRDAALDLLGLISDRLKHPAKRSRAIDILSSVRLVRRRKYDNVWTASMRRRSIGEVETWDIETEQHNSFFANGYLVHNSGKDDLSLHFTACAAMQKPGNYWHMLPEYNQARKVIWDAVNPKTGKRRIDEAFPESIRAATRKHDMQIELINGSIWQLLGSDNYNRYVGSPPRGVIFSEWSLANPMCWPYIMPILEENGGWAIWIYTMRGNNHGAQLLTYALNQPDWFAQKLTVDDTPVFRPEQLKGIKAELIAIHGSEHGEALFMQEYYCSTEAATLGAIYAKQMAAARKDKRIGNVPHASDIEVDTFWDLGMDDSTTIWFIQTIGREHRVIDYYEATGEGLPHYAKILKEKPYVYGEHYMPHDAAVREMGTGKSRKDTAEDLGIRPVKVVKRARDAQAVRAGIEAGRNIFSQCWFDEKKCAQGLSALEGYHFEYDEEKKKLKDTPAHTWHCLSGDTHIRTLDGWHLIKDLVGKDFYVWGYSLKEHRLLPAKSSRCFQSKIADNIVRVNLDDGKSITCTDDHLFLLRNEGWKQAGELVCGDSLMPFYEKVEKGRGGHVRVYLNDGSIADEHRFICQRYNGVIPNGYHVHHLDKNKRNNNPENLQTIDSQEHCRIHATEPERLEKLRRNSNRRGSQISTAALIEINKMRSGDNHHTRKPGYWTDERRKKTGEASSRSYKNSEKIKICKGCGGEFIGNRQRLYCCDRCKSLSRSGGAHKLRVERSHSPDCKIIHQNIATNHKVISIERLNIAIPVYDITVPELHCFVAEGVVVHNSHGADAWRTFAVGYQPKIAHKTVGAIMRGNQITGGWGQDGR